MTPTVHNKLLIVLAEHIGAEKGISAEEIACALGVMPRQVRAMITDLRRTGVAICGHPTTGYYIAATAAELEETCAFLRSRAMHSLALEAAMRRQTVAELVGQIRTDETTNLEHAAS